MSRGCPAQRGNPRIRRLTGFLDTSVVVRYLTGDPSEQATTAATIIENTERLYLTGVAIAEASYVLRSFYSVSRDVVLGGLMDLVRRENIIVHGIERGLVVRAFGMCRGSNLVSVADAPIWTRARSSGNPVVFSLDRRFPNHGLDVLTEP